jgi:hypothetical protein
MQFSQTSEDIWQGRCKEKKYYVKNGMETLSMLSWQAVE